MGGWLGDGIRGGRDGWGDGVGDREMVGGVV